VYIFPQTRSERYVTHRRNSELQFPNQARYWAEKLLTDISLDPLTPYKDKNFRSSLVSDFWNLMASRENDLLMLCEEIRWHSSMLQLMYNVHSSLVVLKPVEHMSLILELLALTLQGIQFHVVWWCLVVSRCTLIEQVHIDIPSLRVDWVGSFCPWNYQVTCLFILPCLCNDI